MKKKIKDLTPEEKNKICAKFVHTEYECLYCPLSFERNCIDICLEREVEVDESHND